MVQREASLCRLLLPSAQDDEADDDNGKSKGNNANDHAGLHVEISFPVPDPASG
jgi:hypothetical protein